MKKLKSFSYLSLILIFTLFSQVVSTILAEIAYFILQDRSVSDIYAQDTPLSKMLFESVIIAPIIETLLLMGVVELLILIFKKIKNGTWYVVLICGLVFGLLHFYNPAYIIAMFILWTIYAFYYVFVRQKYSSAWLAAAALLLIHALNNLITIYFDYVW